MRVLHDTTSSYNKLLLHEIGPQDQSKNRLKFIVSPE